MGGLRYLPLTTIVSLLCLMAFGAEPDARHLESIYINAFSERWSTAATVTDPTEALRLKTPSSRLAQTVEFGIGDDALWIEFNERPTTFREQPWLEIRNPHLDYLTVFFATHNGEIKQLDQVQGDDLPFAKRAILLRHFVFSLPATQYNITKVWLRVNSTTARSVPIYLSNNNQLFDYLQKRTLADGVFVGLVLLLGIYSLLALAGKRRNLVGAYLVFLLGITLFHFSLWGYGYQWFWPLWPTLQKISPIAGMALTAIGLNVYVARFIGIRRSSHLGLGVIAINCVWLFLTIGSANLNMLTISMSATAASIISSVILGAMVLYHVLSKRTAAIFISIAFGPFIISAVIYSLQKLGLLEFGRWVESILPISTTFQATVLAYGTQLSHERTRQSQEKMSENNLQLQDQLTLESLSRLDLVGNVIHELNNPLNFISASSVGLKEHGKRLKKFRNSLFPEPPDNQDARFMYDIISELISEHERRAQDIIEGAERSEAILAQMRELAELNPQVKREIDVCSLLEPVLSAVNGNNAKFRTRLRIDHSQINEAMPPTLKTSPFILVHSLVRLTRILVESSPEEDREVLIRPTLQGLSILLSFECPGFTGSKAELLADVEADEATQVMRRWFHEQRIKWHLEVVAEGDLIWSLEFELVGNSPTMPILALPLR